jgi:predicted outer membrane repeat protein
MTFMVPLSIETSAPAGLELNPSGSVRPFTTVAQPDNASIATATMIWTIFMRVVNSTFYGNTAVHAGGAIFVGAVTLEVVNSTFLNNTATNGSSIFASFTVPKLNGVILAGASAANNCLGDVNDENFNISDDDSCSFTAGDSRNSTDPLLDPSGLADNGGPTATIALEPGSPAIDQTPKKNCPVTDQRGYRRLAPSEKTCDIGAFELGAQPRPGER